MTTEAMDEAMTLHEEASVQLQGLWLGQAREETAAGLVALLRDIADRIEKHYGCEVETT